jgi:hypothetical protein
MTDCRKLGLLPGVLAVFAFGLSPAHAQQAQCEQQYAAKKAAGQTRPKSKAAFVKGCLTAADPKPAGAAASQGGGENADKLREAAENPVADLISVQFQNNLNFGFGHYNATQNDLNFQPVIPIHLNDDWNIIARPINAGRLSAAARA